MNNLVNEIYLINEYMFNYGRKVVPNAVIKSEDISRNGVFFIKCNDKFSLCDKTDLDENELILGLNRKIFYEYFLVLPKGFSFDKDNMCIFNKDIKIPLVLSFNADKYYANDEDMLCQSVIENFRRSLTIVKPEKDTNEILQIYENINNECENKYALRNKIINFYKENIKDNFKSYSDIKILENGESYFFKEILMPDSSVYISSHKGNREEQEDNYVYALNDDIKLLGVFDGMGGTIAGKEASLIVKNNIKDWFLSENNKTLNYENKLKESMTEAIDFIHKKVCEETKMNDSCGGSTLTTAIINNKLDKTFITNIGDSRLYKYSDKIRLLTEDQSASFLIYSPLFIEDLDNYRFVVDSAIYDYIGCSSNHKIEPQFLKVPNDYNKLLLFTDGVTDIVASSTIGKLCKLYGNDKNLIKEIMLRAIYGTEEERRFNPGKDNATGIVYTRKRK